MSELGKCYNCGNELEFKIGTRMARSETCIKCGKDVRCCFNCTFYDSNNYNECREPQADRVVEKGKANFCDYFSLGSSSNVNLQQQKNQKQALDDLEDLFK